MLYPNQGASALISTTWANGIVVVREQQTIQVGDLIEFIPFSGLS
jgi:molybdopterin biosynthesis enzyme